MGGAKVTLDAEFLRRRESQRLNKKPSPRLDPLVSHQVVGGQFPKTRLSECPYMDSSSFASTLLDGDEVRLLTYIRPLELVYVDTGP